MRHHAKGRSLPHHFKILVTLHRFIIYDLRFKGILLKLPSNKLRFMIVIHSYFNICYRKTELIFCISDVYIGSFDNPSQLIFCDNTRETIQNIILEYVFEISSPLGYLSRTSNIMPTLISLGKHRTTPTNMDHF